MQTINMALPYLRHFISDDKKSLKIEPGFINVVYDYFLVNGLYLPLFYLGPNGELNNGVVTSYNVSDKTLSLKINGKVQTKSGYKITAKDVYYSLKRLLFLNSNTHGKLNLFLSCPEHNLKSLDGKCSSLNYDGDIVKIVVNDEKYIKFLIKVLASPDYAVIPYSSFNHTSANLEIINYSETTGLYYFDSVSSDGLSVILKANQNHFMFNKGKHAETIVLIDTAETNSVRLLEKGKIDVLTYFDNNIDSDKIKSLDKNLYQIGYSQPIKLFNLSFDKDKDSKFTLEERIKISLDIKEALRSEIKDYGVLTDQFFPEFSFGALSKKNRETIKTIIQNTKNKNIKISEKKVNILMAPHDFKLFSKALSSVDYIEVSEFKVFSESEVIIKQLKDKDATFTYGDTGFSESISLISYYMNWSHSNLSLSPEEGEIWLKNYMSLDSKEERGKKFKDFHFMFLNKFTLLPLFITNYVLVTRKPLKYKGGSLLATNNLWDFEIE